MSQHIQELYECFAKYADVGEQFCTLCHSDQEIAAIKTSPLDRLDPELTRTLLWEASDHWENTNVYRHYLPRLLEVLGSPWFESVLYPLHLSETLLKLEFSNWPQNERLTVIAYLESGVPEFVRALSATGQIDWAAGIAKLRGA